MNKLFAKVTAVAAGAALAVAVLAPGAASAKATGSPVIYNCAGNSHYMPRALTLYCGDGNDAITKIDWKHWGQSTATATATDELNLCTPNCAAGKVHGYKVTVSVSDLRGKGAAARYGTLKMTFAGKRPKGVKKTTHFKLTKRGPVAA